MSSLLNYFIFPASGNAIDFQSFFSSLDHCGLIPSQLKFQEEQLLSDSDGGERANQPRRIGARKIEKSEWRSLANRCRYYSLSMIVSPEIVLSNFLASENGYIEIALDFDLLRELPESEREQLNRQFVEAAFVAGAAYIVEGVSVCGDLPDRFVEIEGKRLFDPYLFSGFTDSVSCILFCPENGGQPIEGKFLTNDHELNFGHWVHCWVEYEH